MTDITEALVKKVGAPVRLILADPPWSFDDKLPGDGRGAEKNYAVMSTEDIMRMPLPPIAENAMLLLWRVASQQQEALDVARCWGFKVKSEIVWKKLTSKDNEHFGMGRYVRATHEVCLVATRGRFQVADKAVRSMFEAQVGAHSAKPDEIYRIAERLAGPGTGPLVELFSRLPRAGWHCFGNELPDGYVFTPGAVADVGTPAATPAATAIPTPAAPIEVAPEIVTLSPAKARAENLRLLKTIEADIKKRTALVRLAFDAMILRRDQTTNSWEHLCEAFGKIDHVSDWLIAAVAKVSADPTVAGVDLRPGPAPAIVNAAPAAVATPTAPPTPTPVPAPTPTVTTTTPPVARTYATWDALLEGAQEDDDDGRGLAWSSTSTTMTGTVPADLRGRSGTPLPSGAIPAHVLAELREHPASTPEDRRRRLVLLAVREGLLDDGLPFDEAWVRFQYVAPIGWVRDAEARMAAAMAPLADAVEGCGACARGVPKDPDNAFKHECIPGAHAQPETAPTATGDKKARACSVCKMPGHTARTCPAKAKAAGEATP